MSADITPFSVNIAAADLDDLADRLARTRLPDELPGVGGDYGAPLARIVELVEYWRGDYDWRAHEATLNEFPQFTTVIDGQKIHFIHVRSPEPHALPLVLTHGWPGSIVEFLDVIRPLADPRAHGGDPADAFDVVVPSLPGFGFSGPTREKGWHVPRVARAWAELMSRLGYDRFGAQGGDWGSAVSRMLGDTAPERVVGVHLNYLPTPPPPNGLAGLSPHDQARLAEALQYLANPAGHFVLQSTKPQTLAFALTDSPVGQLAWLVEKFDDWSDPAHRPSNDRILTNVMLYWLTRTAASSARLYRESGRQPLPCPVPVGVAVFPHDIALSVRGIAEQTYPIVHWSEFDRGGHFAAIEVPELLVDDVRVFFRSLR